MEKTFSLASSPRTGLLGFTEAWFCDPVTSSGGLPESATKIVLVSVLYYYSYSYTGSMHIQFTVPVPYTTNSYRVGTQEFRASNLRLNCRS
jgi:hypothetical protein